MKFSFKSISAAIQVAAVFNEMYRGTPLTIKALSDETGLSVSYLSKCFHVSVPPGSSEAFGAWWRVSPEKRDLTVSDVIRSVSAGKIDFLEPVLLLWRTSKSQRLRRSYEKNNEDLRAYGQRTGLRR